MKVLSGGRAVEWQESDFGILAGSAGNLPGANSVILRSIDMAGFTKGSLYIGLTPGAGNATFNLSGEGMNSDGILMGPTVNCKIQKLFSSDITLTTLSPYGIYMTWDHLGNGNIWASSADDDQSPEVNTFVAPWLGSPFLAFNLENLAANPLTIGIIRIYLRGL
jgi:hypothetical protein